MAAASSICAALLSNKCFEVQWTDSAQLSPSLSLGRSMIEFNDFDVVRPSADASTCKATYLPAGSFELMMPLLFPIA